MRSTVLLLLACTLPFALHGADGDPQLAADYDEIIHDLVPNLGKDNVSAQDAALKLSRLGKRAIPVLTELLRTNLSKKTPLGNAALDPKQVAAYDAARRLTFYTVLALSRIKTEDAARLLLPILKDPKALPELRAMALEAHGMEKLKDGGEVLVDIATNDPEPEFKKKALIQLSIMPEFWIKAEKLFVDGLSSTDDEMRILCAKQCYFARVYLTAGDKLIELAEKDYNDTVRMQAMLALGRMRTQRAVPVLVKILIDDRINEREKTQVVRTINDVTGIQFKNAAGVDAWWKRQGEKEYAKLAEAEAVLKKDPAPSQHSQPGSPAAQTQASPAQNPPLKRAPETPNVLINPPEQPGQPGQP